LSDRAEDPTRTIPNTERRALDKQIRAGRADLARLEREYGAAAADNAEQRRRRCAGSRSLTATSASSYAPPTLTWHGSSSGASNASEVRDLNERAVVKLATKRKHLTDIIKMIAYQAESDLLALP
jgi:hypothetical protein